MMADYTSAELKKILREVRKIKKSEKPVKRTKFNPEECYSVEDFLDYYTGACKPELKAALKGLQYNTTQKVRNHKDAIIALLN